MNLFKVLIVQMCGQFRFHNASLKFTENCSLLLFIVCSYINMQFSRTVLQSVGAPVTIS